MPALGADMEAGTIIEWLVKPGDTVKRGDIIAVVDTEKATIEVEVFETGVIRNIVVAEGEKVPIGTVLALISTDGEVVLPPTEVKPKPIAAPPQVIPPPAPPRPVAPPRIEKPPPSKAPTVAPHRLRVSPLAMRVALDLKVDLSTVKGTGSGRRHHQGRHRESGGCHGNCSRRTNTPESSHSRSGSDSRAGCSVSRGNQARTAAQTDYRSGRSPGGHA